MDIGTTVAARRRWVRAVVVVLSTATGLMLAGPPAVTAGVSGPAPARWSPTEDVVDVMADPPAHVAARAYDRSIEVSWAPPATFGTGSLSGYTATVEPDGTTCTTASDTRCTITGLANGASYTITVVTHTDAGDSAPSAPSGPITPGARLSTTGNAATRTLVFGLGLLVTCAAGLVLLRLRRARAANGPAPRR